MSERTELDLRAELARIDRDRDETDKLTAESQKLTAEQHKLMREGEKFRAEEWKLWRDWRLAPWVFAASLLAAVIGGIIARHVP